MDYRKRLIETKKLPTIPQVAARLLKLAQQEQPDLEEISGLVSLDPAIAGRLLTAVNSPLFGLKFKVNSIPDAIPKLGLSLVRTLVLGFHLADYRSAPALKNSMRVHWRRSLVQAVVAEMIAELVDPDERMNYFLAGLVQDIGVLAMLGELSDEYLASGMFRESINARTLRAEFDSYKISHPELSAEIVRRWGLDESIAQAIAQHHHRLAADSSDAVGKMALALQTASRAVQVLDINPAKSKCPENNDSIVQLTDFMAINFGYDKEQTSDLLLQCVKRVNEYASILSFDIASTDDCQEILRQANLLLQDLAVSAQLQLYHDAQSNDDENALDNIQQVYLDEMTGFYNRRYLTHKLEPEMRSAIAQQQTVCVLFIDVDKFKSINDEYGHAAGDAAIKQIAAQINKNVRLRDTVVRYGGDEFVLFLPGLKSNRLGKVAQRFAAKPVKIKTETGKQFEVTLSVGGAYCDFRWQDHVGPNQLIDAADQAMYQSKRKGGANSTVCEVVAIKPASLQLGEGLPISASCSNAT